MFLLCLSTILFAQGVKPTYKDSIELNKVWIKYKHALENKDIASLHRLSYKIIHCDRFEPENSSFTKDPNLPLDTFLSRFYHVFPDLKLWRVVKTKKYHMTIDKASNWALPNIKFQRKKSLMVYNIWYLVFKPNEISKGNEGLSEAFQFMKIDGQFKLCGLTSIP
jgi:hypothetical protein